MITDSARYWQYFTDKAIIILFNTASEIKRWISYWKEWKMVKDLHERNKHLQDQPCTEYNHSNNRNTDQQKPMCH
jgi:hypothetical protein